MHSFLFTLILHTLLLLHHIPVTMNPPDAPIPAWRRQSTCTWEIQGMLKSDAETLSTLMLTIRTVYLAKRWNMKPAATTPRIKPGGLREKQLLFGVQCFIMNNKHNKLKQI